MAQLIVFLPLIGFLFCFFFGKIFSFKVSQIFTTSLLFISAILSWILFFSYIGERETQIIHIFNWFTSGNFIVDWSIRLDSLTTTMFIVVFIVHINDGWEKIETPLLYLFGFVTIFFCGPGKYSIDRKLS